MKVKYLDLGKQFNCDHLWAYVRSAIANCDFVLGAEVEKFEKNFADLCGVKYALGLNSGTDALFLALKALGIGAGDEVVTAPNSFLATAGAIVATGATPIFVDVSDDYNIDPALIQDKITSCTKAIIPVHLTGNPAQMDNILDVAKRFGLFVVEDACQAVQASIKGQRTGSFGHFGCFSLHPLKNLNVCGDGGVLTTSDGNLYHRVKLMRNHGLKNRDEIEFFAFNSRLDTIQAAVANYFMKQLDEVTTKRIANARLYDSLLGQTSPFVNIPPRKDNVRQVFHTYVMRAKDRAGLIDHLLRCGIESKIHYPLPIHLQKPCRNLGYKKGDFPECERQSEEIISLPVHQYLEPDQIAYVCEAIKKYYHNRAS